MYAYIYAYAYGYVYIYVPDSEMGKSETCYRVHVFSFNSCKTHL